MKKQQEIILDEIEIISVDGAQHTFRRKNGTIGVMTVNHDPSMTQQQFEPETNINNIMDKYIAAPDPQIFIRSGKGTYGDFSKAKDFQSSVETIKAATDSFMSLHAKVRSRFDNDPHKLFAFLNDDQNYEEAVNLGLIERKMENAKTNQNENAKPSTEKTNPTPAS